MANPESRLEAVELASFLASTPPYATVKILTRGLTVQQDGRLGTAYLNLPEINIYCDFCDGSRYFSSSEDTINFHARLPAHRFLYYTCKNCSMDHKAFALSLSTNENGDDLEAFKFGEMPPFGPPTPTRLLRLLGRDKELFLKGRRCESQSLGIAAFSYYRRIVELRKNDLLDEVIRVCERLGKHEILVGELRTAKDETQFEKAVKSIHHALPDSLLLNGRNPFTLLHGALSKGLHAEDDETCLDLAQSVRVVLSAFIERLNFALQDENELTIAVNKLIASRNSKVGNERE
ncbi:hypothetical protein AB4Y89_16540 [Terriglobus sp. 2YAB30_2]|uniref:hypothetical protein n=1 Tax=unclassified Terriglobus TaxID=2628988 RepID=UPI003F9699B9